MDTFKQNILPGSLPLMYSNGLTIVQTYLCPSHIEFSISLDYYGRFALLTSNSVFIFNGIDLSNYLIHTDHFKRIAFFKTLRQYVCLQGNNIISVRCVNMMELSYFKSNTEISCLCSNEIIPEIPTVVTCGPGNITIWSFRVGAKYISPRVIHTHLFSEDDSPQFLLLDSNHAKKQKCYIAIADLLIIILIDSGALIVRIPQIHCSPISCVLPLVIFSFLITGSTNGVVKVWDKDYNLLYSFIGSEEMIMDVIFIPETKMILTSSRDSTLRMWNLETGDLCHSLMLPSPAYKVYSMNNDKIFVQTQFSIFELKINDIYTFYRSFPSPISNMGYYSGSSIVILTTSTMLAMLDINGPEILNVLWVNRILGDIKQVILLEEYSRIFVLTELGNIIVGKTDTFPIDTIEIWKGNYSCFTLYSRFLEDSLIQDSFNNSFSNECDKSIGCPYILITGSSTGMLRKLNLFNGLVEFSTMAHGNEIVRIVSHMRNEQVLTCSIGSIIKIWRVYPHVHECLLQINAFELISFPSLMVASKNRICFAINCSDQALNSIQIYDTHTLKQYTHKYSEDHHDTIVDLAVCTSLGIFVSVGIDETVRIWDEDNTLLSVLWLFCCPTCICFLNERADLLFAFNQQLFSIITQNYIPEGILNKLLGITMNISHKGNISSFYGPLDKITSNGLKELGMIDNRGYQNCQTRLKCVEGQIFHSKRNDDECPFDRLRVGDCDLEMQIESSTFVKKVKKIKNVSSSHKMEFWKEYCMKCFSPPYEMNIKYDDELIDHEQLEEETSIEEFLNSNSNFFHPRDVPFKSGFIPNSTYLQNFAQEKNLITEYSTLNLTKILQLSKGPNIINLAMGNGPDTSLLEESQYSYLDSIIEDSKDSEQPISTTNSITDPKINFYSREPSKKLINNKRVSKVTKTSEKPILVINQSQLNSSLSHNLNVISTPSVPKILEQFLSKHWFKEIFPNLTSKTFPCDCSLSSCFSIIFTECSNNRCYKTTIAALQAMILLDEQSSFTVCEKDHLLVNIIDKLLCPANPITILRNKEFTYACLSLLDRFCSSNNLQYISYLLTEFLLGDLETRTIVLDYFKSYGLSDPFNCLSKELDSWNIEVYKSSFLKNQLLKYTMDWLNELIMSNTICTTDPSQFISTFVAKAKTNCIEALNHLVKRNTQLGLKTNVTVANLGSHSPHIPFIIEPPLKSVITLPRICSSQKIIRMGETHNSQCHYERETTLHNYIKSPFIGEMKSDTSKGLLLHIPVRHQNITLCQPNQSKIIVERLKQKKKYFLLTQSQLI